MRFTPFLHGLALLLALATSAFASTIVVDANGTGQFSDIPAAIDAAQDGDVIVVLPGAYSGFTLTKSLTIVGVNTPVLVGPTTIAISGIPTGERAVVVDLRATGLWIQSCGGSVIAQEVTTLTGLALTVAQSADVRLRGITVRGPTSPQASRIEMARCTIQGPNGVNGAGADGQSGIRSNGANRLHLVQSTVSGGHGGNSNDFICTWGGSGALALYAAPTDAVIVVGGQLQGGNGGGALTCIPGSPCLYRGHGSWAVWAEAGSTFRHSVASLSGGFSWNSTTCEGISSPGSAGPGTIVQAVPFDPSLDLIGAPIAGATVQFVVRALPTSTARLSIGRAPVVVADGLAVVERLVGQARVVDVGIVPVSGQTTLSWTIPALPRGTLLVAQADVVLPGGELRRTNSLPVVVR